ncbi:putative Transposon TX1 [Gossypium australe]|uniref:Putative Transposon TX1 n=1 Tax=Gossypium australe TaxID=47621 RepID=A0A5B6WUF3_9ROSI|nr:putative Transposon TX1 [Gossypium australe]
MVAICTCKIGSLPINYLGIPLGANPKKIATWEQIVDRVKKKLSSWMSRTLSWAGTVVLINVVLSFLLIFFMSLFNAPVTIIKNIDKIRRNFFWGNTEGKNKMAKVDWNIVCKPKVKGGAGVVNLGVKNKALLAKWSWRFEIEKEALWRKVILAKYGSKVQRWHFKMTNPKDMSSVWRGIVKNFKDVVMPKWVGVESFYWQIGNGRTVLFGIVIWCGNMPLKQGFPRLFRLARHKESSVADLFRSAGLCRDDWNEFFTRSLLGREEVMRRELAERVSGMVLIPDMEDKLCWANDKNDECRIDTIISNSAASFWRPPPHGWLKFNVCGVAKEDRASYGGVLRDKEGVARALFSGSVVANDADMAETGAIKVALEVFLVMNWKINDSLFIELGSLMVFSWCVNKVMRPWSLQAIFASTDRDMLKARNVVFLVADEKGNELASSSVIAGFNRENMFKAWW